MRTLSGNKISSYFKNNKLDSIHRQKNRPFLRTRPKYGSDIYIHRLDWDDGIVFHDSIEYYRHDLGYYTVEPYMLYIDSKGPRTL